MKIVKIEKYNEQLVVSSRVIAEQLGKLHKNVLADLEKVLENNRAEISALFIKSEYKASNGKMNKEYLLTKDGFTLYMFNIQGYQDFKLAYINKFNEMERELKKKEQLTISFNFDDFEKEIIQLRARANAIKRELLEKRFLLDEKIKYLDRTGLTDHMEVYRENGKVYTMQSL